MQYTYTFVRLSPESFFCYFHCLIYTCFIRHRDDDMEIETPDTVVEFSGKS